MKHINRIFFELARLMSLTMANPVATSILIQFLQTKVLSESAEQRKYDAG